jgi:tRNA A37 threonylcarbamoyladenosine biosynthesis protein TsaE
VEWADRIEGALTEEGLWVHMKYMDEFQRDLLLTGKGKRFEDMIERLRRQMYGG